MVIDFFAVMANALWLYEPKTHRLLPHLPDDIRAQTGLQVYDRGQLAPTGPHTGCVFDSGFRRPTKTRKVRSIDCARKATQIQ